jgi:hypothetical protein
MAKEALPNGYSEQARNIVTMRFGNFDGDFPSRLWMMNPWMDWLLRTSAASSLRTIILGHENARCLRVQSIGTSRQMLGLKIGDVTTTQSG